MAPPSLRQVLLLSLPAMVNQAAGPLSILIETAFVGHSANGVASQHRLAVYGAVQATITFSSGLFTFLLSVTLAQVSKAIGRSEWKAIGNKVQTAIVVAMLSSALCCGLLLMVQDPLLQFLGLSSELRTLAEGYYTLRAASLSLMFLYRVAQGVLTGFGQITAVCAVSCIGAAVETLGAYLCLSIYHTELQTLGYISIASYGSMVLIGGALAFKLRPSLDINLCCSPRKAEQQPLLQDDTPSTSSSYDMALREYLRAAGNIALRSIVLQLAVYGLTIAAGQLDPAALAANQIAAQLWAVTSYLCDGFADVGTMLGGAMVGRGEWQDLRRLAQLIIQCGIVTGLVVGVTLGLAPDSIQHLFTHDTATLQHLNQGLWWLLVGMQPINSLVFVYDGLLYAVQAFAFKRNIVALGGFGVYLPVMLLTLIGPVPTTLLAIWIGYAGLTTLRFAGAIWQFGKLLEKASG
eukprot:m.32666 g.32666  ORF g.32666 m.32666 type:complete len:463 (+) comp12169_c0_seq1:3-1391(+)